jgi:hypothetical protein
MTAFDQPQLSGDRPPFLAGDPEAQRSRFPLLPGKGAEKGR